MTAAYSSIGGLENFPFWGAPVLTDKNGDLICPGFEGKTFSDSVWDYVAIALQAEGPQQEGVVAPSAIKKTPGKCEVNLTKNVDTDRKKPAGSSGARVTVHGVNAAEGEIQITVWTPQQFKILQQMWLLMFPTSGIPYAFDVSHPVFQQHSISSIIAIGASGPTVGSIPRSKMFTIRFVEFLPPPPPAKKATSTPPKALSSTLEANKIATPGSNPKNTVPN